MAFSDLTAEQQGIVAEYTRQQRAVVGEFARLLNRMEALDNMYDGQVTAAWHELTDEQRAEVLAHSPLLAKLVELLRPVYGE